MLNSLVESVSRPDGHAFFTQNSTLEMRPATEADKKRLLELLLWNPGNEDRNDPELDFMKSELFSYLWRIQMRDHQIEEYEREMGNQWPLDDGVDFYPIFEEPLRQNVITDQRHDRQFLIIRGFMLLEAAARMLCKRLVLAGAKSAPWDERTGKLSSRIRDVVCKDLKVANRNDKSWDTLDLLCEVRNKVIHDFTALFDGTAGSQTYSKRCKAAGILWVKPYGHLISDDGMDLIESTFERWIKVLVRESV